MLTRCYQAKRISCRMYLVFISLISQIHPYIYEKYYMILSDS